MLPAGKRRPQTSHPCSLRPTCLCVSVCCDRLCAALEIRYFLVAGVCVRQREHTRTSNDKTYARGANLVWNECVASVRDALCVFAGGDDHHL